MVSFTPNYVYCFKQVEKGQPRFQSFKIVIAINKTFQFLYHVLQIIILPKIQSAALLPLHQMFEVTDEAGRQGLPARCTAKA